MMLVGLYASSSSSVCRHSMATIRRHGAFSFRYATFSGYHPPCVAQACVSRLYTHSNTIVPDRVVCYKSVTNSAGTGCGARMTTFMCRHVHMEA